MHTHIKQLYELANKPARLIIGLMSGTSLDGLDIALCRIEGQGYDTKCEVIAFKTALYDDEYRTKVREVFAKQHGSIEHLCLLNAWIGRHHALLVNQAIKEFGLKAQDIDVIASHGQTVYHCPQEQHKRTDFGNATLQIGDGDHIAVLTGITTLSDFRQKHIAAGGQGAPLVMYGDELLFSSADETRILLNIGGIANLSFVPQLNVDTTEDSAQTTFSSDIGPGNTIMDAYIQKHFAPLQYDKDANIASAGKVNQALLTSLLQSEFLQQKLPKTTGPEVFNLTFLETCQQSTSTTRISKADVMATLCEFTATCIANSIVGITQGLSNIAIYASGGGIHNPLLMSVIEQKIKMAGVSSTLNTTQDLALNPDAKEAVLFAILANETLCRDDDNFAMKSTPQAHITMGKVSFPD